MSVPTRATSWAAARPTKLRAVAEATPRTSFWSTTRSRPARSAISRSSTGRRVLDRNGLILDIFAQRARSFEGKLEVELAQLKHIASRLVRGWTHLERQKGGIGMRGPGETQLETDRRLLGAARARADPAAGEDPATARDRAAAARRDSRSRRSRWSAIPTREVDAVSLAHRQRTPTSPTSCSQHSIRQYAASALPGGTPWSPPIRLASSASCPTSWWPRSSRRCTEAREATSAAACRGCERSAS